MDNLADDSDEESRSSLDDEVDHLTELARRLGINFDVIPPSRWDASPVLPPFYGRMMLQIQEDLLRLTDNLLSNGGINNIFLRSGFDIDGNAEGDDDYNGYEPYLARHDESLLPLWRAFTDALRDAPADDVASFFNCGIQLSGEVYDMLSVALHNKHVARIFLHRADLGREGLTFLAAHIEGNPLLRELTLHKNPIDDLDLAARVFGAIKRRREISRVILTSCVMGSANNDLTRIIANGCDNLVYLDLQCNEIGSEGAKHIANLLGKNPRLETLRINSNDIGDAGIDAVGRALVSNSNLKALYVKDNNGFTKIGRDELQRAIYNTSSLNTIKDSNHICRIDCWSKEDPAGLPIQLCSRLNKERYDMQVRIKSKLLFALGAYFDQGPFNFQYLSDVPSELMPRVLSFVQMTNIVPESAQRFVLDKPIAGETPLRNVFEVVKLCLVPLLSVPQSLERERKRARVEVGQSREGATGNGEGSTLTHEARLLPNRIAIDGKLSERQCYSACELLDDFMRECRRIQDKRYIPLINNPQARARRGTGWGVSQEQYDRILSLARLLRERLGKRNGSNGLVELLRCSGGVYESHDDEYEKMDCLRRDVKMLCPFLNLSPCQLGTTVEVFLQR